MARKKITNETKETVITEAEADRLWKIAIDRFKPSEEDKRYFPFMLMTIVSEHSMKTSLKSVTDAKNTFRDLAKHMAAIVELAKPLSGSHIAALRNELETATRTLRKRRKLLGLPGGPTRNIAPYMGLENLPEDLLGALNSMAEIGLACQKLAKNFSPTVEFNRDTFETYQPLPTQLMVARAIKRIFNQLGKPFTTSETSVAADCFRAVMAKLGIEIGTVENWLRKAKHGSLRANNP